MTKVNESDQPEVKSTESTKSTGAAKTKKDNTLKIVLIVLGVMVGLGVIGAIAVTILAATLFKSATKNVKINSDGEKGNITIQSDDGKSQTSIGEGAKLPDGWPSDVAVYQPSTLIHATNSEDKRYLASFKTDDTSEQVASFYKSELAQKGWKSSSQGSYDSVMTMTYKKDDQQLSITVSSRKDNGFDSTVGSISVFPETKY